MLFYLVVGVKSLDEILFLSDDVFGYDVEGDVVKLLARRVDPKVKELLSRLGYKVEVILIRDVPKALGR